MDNEHDNCACNEYNELASRREFLTKSGGAVGAAAFALAFPEWLPQVSIADTYIANRDVVVSIFLRGGADGLSLCVPFGDNEYYLGRPTLAIPRPDSTAANKAIALDNFFGLPPNLGGLLPAWQAGNLVVVHGAGLLHASLATRVHVPLGSMIEYTARAARTRRPMRRTAWVR